MFLPYCVRSSSFSCDKSKPFRVAQNQVIRLLLGLVGCRQLRVAGMTCSSVFNF